MNITLKQAERIIDAAKKGAQERGERIALAVVDAGGNLVAFARMDGANLITIDTGIGKAYTALSMNIDTLHLTPLIQSGQPLFGVVTSIQQAHPIVPYGGGIVLRQEGEVIGALGISGAAASETDHEIGIEAVGALDL